MARTLRDAKLDTRAARLRLTARREPHWRSLSEGLSIGYRRAKKGGTWIARHYSADLGRRYHALEASDDVADADGVHVLSFAQAQEKAREWFADLARRDRGDHEFEVYSVRDAMQDYLAWYDTHRKDVRNVRYRADALILPALGELKLSQLSTRRMQAWLDGLAKAPARLRTAPGAPQRYRAASSSREHLRRRRASANKALTILKAALNRAWREGKAASDEAWRRVRPFQDVDAPIIRYLTEAECVRLVNACEPTFRQLVRAALLTGCRYGELAALRVADFNPDSGTLAVRESKSGKPRHVVLTEEGQIFFAEVAAGRSTNERMFLRDDGHPWGKSHQARPLARACRRAGIKPALSFHVLRHTHGSQLAMAGVPIPVIAKQLGHADTRITERHYAHLGPSYVASAIRAGFPKLGIVERGKVAAMPAKERGGPAL